MHRSIGVYTIKRNGDRTYRPQDNLDSDPLVRDEESEIVKTGSEELNSHQSNKSDSATRCGRNSIDLEIKELVTPRESVTEFAGKSTWRFPGTSALGLSLIKYRTI